MPRTLRGRVLGAQDTQHPAQFGEGFERVLADAGQILPQLVGGVLHQMRGDLGLDGDHRHVVGDHVVQLAGDPVALLQQGAPGPLLGRQLGLDDEVPTGEAQAAQCRAEDQGDDEHRCGAVQVEVVPLGLVQREGHPRQQGEGQRPRRAAQRDAQCQQEQRPALEHHPHDAPEQPVRSS